jgi:hypothetical protein
MTIPATPNGCWTIRGGVAQDLALGERLFPASSTVLDELARCFDFEAELT